MDASKKVAVLYGTIAVMTVTALVLAIVAGQQTNETNKFNSLYETTKCGKRTVVTFETPFAQNVSDTLAEVNCYFYKHLPHELIDGDPVTVSPVLIGFTILSWVVLIALVVYCQLNHA